MDKMELTDYFDFIAEDDIRIKGTRVESVAEFEVGRPRGHCGPLFSLDRAGAFD
jgi:hypothetical protein